MVLSAAAAGRALIALHQVQCLESSEKNEGARQKTREESQPNLPAENSWQKPRIPPNVVTVADINDRGGRPEPIEPKNSDTYCMNNTPKARSLGRSRHWGPDPV